jgi:hypothetical protein
LLPLLTLVTLRDPYYFNSETSKLRLRGTTAAGESGILTCSPAAAETQLHRGCNQAGCSNPMQARRRRALRRSQAVAFWMISAR